MTVVLKFGGSSVKNSQIIRSIFDIVYQKRLQQKKLIVVFSASGKTTSKLIQCVELASSGKSEYLTILNSINKQYFEIIDDLFNNNIQRKELIKEKILISLNKIGDILRGIFLITENYKKTNDWLLSFGEGMTSMIMYNYFSMGLEGNIQFLDSREVIKTNSNYCNADVNMKLTIDLIKQYLNNNEFDLLVVPGFVARSELDNSTTTIGRGGSDYTASIFGVGASAECVEIWTDVNGILTCDPNIIKDAQEIPEMSYNEMFELSYYGGKVLYHKTISPLYKHNIPLYIKNTYNPEHHGTKVSNEPITKNKMVSAISCLKEISLLQLNGSLLQGNVGIASRIFTALSKKKVNMIIISQSSSEIAINIGINTNQSNIAKKCINDEFKKEMEKGKIHFNIKDDVSVIAAIATHENTKCKILEKLLQIVNQNNIHIYMHNSSGLNSCIVIDQHKLVDHMNIIHNSFFTKNGYTRSAFILGLGNIGSGLFELISKRHDINIIGVANSRKCLLGESLEKINLQDLKNDLNNSSTLMDLDQFVNEMIQNSFVNKIIIDCTSNTIIPTIYETLLNNNIKVVTPNKKSMSEDYQLFKKLFKYYQKNLFQFETTVVAGLPAINLIDSLVRCNHHIKKIEGMFSGTLNYVLSSFMNKDSITITDVVKNAHQSGYTEPNPLDDLNGMDVARKMLILARIIGLEINLVDIPVKGLVEFSANDATEFFEKMPELNNLFQTKKDSAKQNHKTLKYIASYDAYTNTLSVEMKEVDKNHPFYNINGTNNVIAITTNIYTDPVILTGFGAGKFQTASGVLNDMLKM